MTGGGCSRSGKWEDVLVKTNMPRCKNPTSHWIIAAVAAVIQRIAEKNTRQGAVLELVVAGGGCVRIAQLHKQLKTLRTE